MRILMNKREMMAVCVCMLVGNWIYGGYIYSYATGAELIIPRKSGLSLLHSSLQFGFLSLKQILFAFTPEP